MAASGDRAALLVVSSSQPEKQHCPLPPLRGMMDPTAAVAAQQRSHRGQQRAGGGAAHGGCGRGPDGAMCYSLADSGYRPALGARSLTEAAHRVDNPLVKSYWAQNEPIVGGMSGRDFTVDVKAGEVVVSLHR